MKARIFRVGLLSVSHSDATAALVNEVSVHVSFPHRLTKKANQCIQATAIRRA
jgi:hypothetical protein